ncbi:DeoR/GlpR family DNA-binding transcription regulator [Microbacterium invictum]|uniref:Lactose phosphotransferase system repressor n=1 Tax=Microbacterium invictum TaxID=515415 RepID=A0AA40VLI9_9MICO|nr:DeoR/GlpR family DNA-binding transcription regulator [Microbacterium invictum]MBB4138872.1 DeoR family fructose operon transcriptional repressor [Microbacterium invictum]
MYATERQQLIEQTIAADGSVAVVELAQRFDVTTETVRRDLAQLERAGVVRRVHGGAVAQRASSIAESSLVDRAQRHGEAKRAIARRALDALGDDFTGSVYLDAGTSTAALAQLLLERQTQRVQPLEVVTHSMTVAHLMAGAAGVALTAIGGRVRGLTAAAVGAGTVRAIEGLRPDIAFLGTNGVSGGFGLSTPDPEEAAVKRAIVTSARRVITLAHAEKLDQELLVAFAGLDDVDLLVTDAAPPAPLAAALEEAGTDVWLA